MNKVYVFRHREEWSRSIDIVLTSGNQNNISHHNFFSFLHNHLTLYQHVFKQRGTQIERERNSSPSNLQSFYSQIKILIKDFFFQSPFLFLSFSLSLLRGRDRSFQFELIVMIDKVIILCWLRMNELHQPFLLWANKNVSMPIRLLVWRRYYKEIQSNQQKMIKFFSLLPIVYFLLIKYIFTCITSQHQIQWNCNTLQYIQFVV